MFNYYFQAVLWKPVHFLSEQLFFFNSKIGSLLILISQEREGNLYGDRCAKLSHRRSCVTETMEIKTSVRLDVPWMKSSQPVLNHESWKPSTSRHTSKASVALPSLHSWDCSQEMRMHTRPLLRMHLDRTPKVEIRNYQQLRNGWGSLADQEPMTHGVSHWAAIVLTRVVVLNLPSAATL